MKACGSCNTWIPDEARTCPSCGREPGAAGPAGPPPPPPPSAGPSLPREEAAAAAREARRAIVSAEVRRLGLLYMVLGGIVLASVLLSFVNFATGEALRSVTGLRQQTGPELKEVWDGLEGLYESPLYLAFAHGLPFAMGVLLLYAGHGLRELRGRTPALVAAALMLVPSPHTGCCCCAAIPLGIYALVVLLREDTAAVMRG